MALVAAGMRERIKAHIAAVPPYQGSDAAAAQAYRDAVLLAMCEGIIEEIRQNAVVTTTSGAPDGEHTGRID